MGKVSHDLSKEMMESIRQQNDPNFNTDRQIRAKRLRVSFPVNVTLKGSPIQGWAEVENISWSGMLLLTNFSLNVQDEFTLEFTLPGHDIPLQIAAKTVRVMEGITHDSPTMIAVAFFKIDPHVSKIISGFVLENLSHI